MKRTLIIATMMALSVSACTTGYAPSVEPPSLADTPKFQADLGECQSEAPRSYIVPTPVVVVWSFPVATQHRMVDGCMARRGYLVVHSLPPTPVASPAPAVTSPRP